MITIKSYICPPVKSGVSEAHFLMNLCFIIPLVDNSGQCFHYVAGMVRFLSMWTLLMCDIMRIHTPAFISFRASIGAVCQKLVLRLAICFCKACSNLTTFEVAILSKISTICQVVQNYCEGKTEMFADLVIT